MKMLFKAALFLLATSVSRSAPTPSGLEGQNDRSVILTGSDREKIFDQMSRPAPAMTEKDH